jgi:hypothetical protein
MNENTLAAAEAELNSKKPKIFLPSDDRSVSEFAAQLGECLRKAEADIFIRGMRVVEARPPEKHKAAQIAEVDPERFRTWVEDYVVTMARRQTKMGNYDVICSMSRDHAAAVLKSPQFQKCLRPLLRIYSCAVPANTADGSMRLLKRGYDAAEAAYVSGLDDYADEVKSDAEAKEILLDIFSEFRFEDDGRSLSVAIAAMLTPYTRLLLRPTDNVPFFAYTANDAGAGKTLCAKVATITMFGSGAETPVKKDPDEIPKVLATKLLEGAGFILFDNVRVALDCPALEAYATSGEVEDRLLRKNESVRGIPAVIYITGNGMKLRGDLPSRVLWVELFMPESDPSDRVFKRDLDEADLYPMRRRLLSACYRLVASWVAAGRPVAKCTSRFKQWAKVVGSILRFHDFIDPTSKPTLQSGEMGEPEQIAMMIAGMDPARKYTLTEVIDVCTEAGAFEDRLKEWKPDDETDKVIARAIRSYMGDVLRKIRGRIYNGRTLQREGTAKKRMYWVEEVRAGFPVRHDTPTDLQTTITASIFPF